jgi:hypothetical protein
MLEKQLQPKLSRRIALGSSVEASSDEAPSDLQDVFVKPTNFKQLTLELLIDGISNVGGDNECFSRVKWWELQRKAKREALRLMYREKYPV